MEHSNFIIKTLIFLTLSLHLSSADPHSRQYIYTAVTGISFPELTIVGVMDGDQFMYYDSNTRKAIPKTEWIKKVIDDDPDYWRTQSRIRQNQEEEFRFVLDGLMQRFNQTEGVHTVQMTYGCELDDDGTTRGYMLVGYDGGDFLSLDKKTGTWTAANAKAFFTKLSWDSTGAKAKSLKSYLESECLYWLKKYVSYGRDSLQRKVPPEASVFQRFSSSPELVCHATGFFPRGVMMSWQKDGEDLIEDVELRETLPNQDGSFQKRSILTVSPEDLQKHEYTCVIKHSSLKEDLVLKARERRILRVPGGGSEGVPIGVIIGAVVGVLALVGSASGIIIWKNKSGFKLVSSKPSSRSEGDSTSSESQNVFMLTSENKERGADGDEEQIQNCTEN